MVFGVEEECGLIENDEITSHRATIIQTAVHVASSPEAERPHVLEQGFVALTGVIQTRTSLNPGALRLPPLPIIIII